MRYLGTWSSPSPDIAAPVYRSASVTDIRALRCLDNLFTHGEVEARRAPGRTGHIVHREMLLKIN
jgi:hypothetical protein